MRGVRADLYFIGTCAFDAELGLADFDCEEALLKRAMIEASVATAVVVLREKLGTRAPFLVAEAAAVRHLVVEHGSPENLTAPFAALGVNVHVAGAASDD